MNYRRGTRSEYNIDDTSNKIALGWTPDEIANGKEYTDESGNNYTVTETLRKAQNPETDDYIWEHTAGPLDENDKYNLISTWKRSIIRPAQKKWFIAYNQDHVTTGSVEVGQTMNTGLDRLEIFDDEILFFNRCEELNIDLGGIE